MTADTQTRPDRRRRPGRTDDPPGDPRLRHRGRRADHARPHPLVHRLRRGVDRAHRRARGRRHLHPARPGEEAELLPRRLRPDRRRAGRGPHLHLLRRGEGRRAHQQLDGPRRDEGPHARALRRLHEGPHDVRHPVRDGPPRRREADVRRGDHRLRLRHGLDAGDGPHGHRRPAPDGGARRRVRARACTRSACRWPRPGRRRVAVQRHQVHRAVPRGADDLVLRLRATAATRCSARSATPCASPA